LKSYIEHLDFTIEHLLCLVDGCLGKPYLDAIVNSALDADKVDYIFRDLHFLDMAGNLEHRRLGNSVGAPAVWRADFLQDQELSPEGLIRVNGRSVLSMLELLETRRNLYFKFYLSPEMRLMERLAAFVLTVFLAHRVPLALGEEIRRTENPFAYDHGELKVKIAAESVIATYDRVMRIKGTAAHKEIPLLDALLCEILDDGIPLDDVPRNVLESIREILKNFPRDENAKTCGSTVQDVYKKLHTGGPYYTDATHETTIREIVRDLILTYQASVLFDAVKTPRFLSTAARKTYGHVSGDRDVIGETFLVLSISPMEWTVKSRAAVPLGAVKFGSLEARYLQIIVFDPLAGC
jgi:HD superfamily phosphohydrolase